MPIKATSYRDHLLKACHPLRTRAIASTIACLLFCACFNLSILQANSNPSSQTKADPTQQRIQMYLGLAQGHFLSGNLQAAQVPLKQILRLDPLNNQALQLQAKILLQNPTQKTSDPSAAQQTLQAINQSLAQSQSQSHPHPNNPQAQAELRLARAQLLAQAGDPQAAIRELQALTAQDPSHIEALLTLSALYSAQNRWQSITALIENPALANNPALTDINLYLKGRIAFAKGRLGTARAHFENALNQQPNFDNRLAPSLHFYHAQTLLQLNRPKQAQAAIQQALQQNFRPESIQETYTLAQTLLQLKTHLESHLLPLLQAWTLNHDPHSNTHQNSKSVTESQLWSLLGHTHRALNQPHQAISAYTQALKNLDSNNNKQTEILALRAGQLRRINQLPAARDDYQTALTLSPQDPALQYALGLTLLQLGQIPQAAQYLKTAALVLPENFEIQHLCAVLALTVNDRDTALKNLENIPESIPTNDYSTQLLKNILKPSARNSQPAPEPSSTSSEAFYKALTQIYLETDPQTKPLSKSITNLLQTAAKGTPDQAETLCAQFLLNTELD